MKYPLCFFQTVKLLPHPHLKHCLEPPSSPEDGLGVRFYYYLFSIKPEKKVKSKHLISLGVFVSSPNILDEKVVNSLIYNHTTKHTCVCTQTCPYTTLRPKKQGQPQCKFAPALETQGDRCHGWLIHAHESPSSAHWGMAWRSPHEGTHLFFLVNP